MRHFNISRLVSYTAFFIFSIAFSTTGVGQYYHQVNDWYEVTDNAHWEPRAGLQVVQLRNSLYVMGGRTPIPSPIPGASIIRGDVWKSNLKGKNWTRVLLTDTTDYWPARAYFSAIRKGKYMYVLGGQNFDNTGKSKFFNDVWRSTNGVTWTPMTDSAAWIGRAGLVSFVFNNEIYVLGGSKNDDFVFENGQPKRIYFNDVWKSKNGAKWDLVTDSANWEARAGMRVVVKNGFIYLMGGETGFTPDQIGTDPPYYNDVWRSKDGKNWKRIVKNAPWSARPGHEVVLYKDHMVLFGGFNLDPGFPFSVKAYNPMDIWASKNGIHWKQLPGTPWNAQDTTDVKYDFHAITIPVSKKNKKEVILTVGGDRETFDFDDELNYTNVDNDVWKYYPSVHKINNHYSRKDIKEWGKLFKSSYPNPFMNYCKIKYDVPDDCRVKICIYSLSGEQVITLCNKRQAKGEHEVEWDGKDHRGKLVKRGFYLVKMYCGSKAENHIVIKR